ncbi:MAG: deoxynucleoside kinase [Alphaproteobacteria bacterium]|nr:deoxynucleoside kinase [Alphaproteobacteria bacterium]
MRRFVAVEGLIGVGKTTLCRLLARERGAELLLEPHADNPFLEPFYREPARYALPVQLTFLLARYHHQDRVRQLSLFQPWVVSDYVFDKDRLFAEKTLGAEDLEVYHRVASTLAVHVPTPDLVVVLDAPVPVLLQRIAQRGIAGEERIDAAYLEDLAERYRVLWDGWARSPVLHVDTTRLDLVSSPAAQQLVLEMIDASLARAGDEAAPPDEDDLFTRQRR